MNCQPGSSQRRTCPHSWSPPFRFDEALDLCFGRFGGITLPNPIPASILPLALYPETKNDRPVAWRLTKTQGCVQPTSSLQRRPRQVALFQKKMQKLSSFYELSLVVLVLRSSLLVVVAKHRHNFRKCYFRNKLWLYEKSIPFCNVVCFHQLVQDYSNYHFFQTMNYRVLCFGSLPIDLSLHSCPSVTCPLTVRSDFHEHFFLENFHEQMTPANSSRYHIITDVRVTRLIRLNLVCTFPSRKKNCTFPI
jgi:hypothetical protein